MPKFQNLSRKQLESLTREQLDELFDAQREQLDDEQHRKVTLLAIQHAEGIRGVPPNVCAEWMRALADVFLSVLDQPFSSPHKQKA